MSDRPTHLKYLKTKMKIILCILLLYITAVSVFGQSQELNSIVGKSIEFPTKVETDGSLMYGGKVIGYVLGGALIPLADPEYQGRMQWDSSTGLFSLSELRLEDSGVYTVNNTNEKTSVSFHLTVWKDNVPVSKPHVSITHNEYPCTIECTAERGTEVTLSWYREGQTKPYVSSRVASAPHLNLPQSVERSGTYTCEAKNSVSRETSDPLTVEAHCTDSNTWMIVGIVVCVIAVAGAMAFFGGYLYSKGHCRKNVVIFDGSTLQAFLAMRKDQERGS